MCTLEKEIITYFKLRVNQNTTSPRFSNSLIITYFKLRVNQNNCALRTSLNLL